MEKEKTVSYERFKELEEWYKHEVIKRDKEIEKLKKSNQVLLKTAFKQAKLHLSMKHIKEDENE